MADLLASIRSGFPERSGIPRPALLVAVRAPRILVALAFALVPALVLLLVALYVAPPEFLDALTLTRNVHDTFARFVTAVTTASAIAVSVAALTLRRELHGLGTLREHHEENRRFRVHAERAAGRARLPVRLPRFLGALAHAASEAARRAREAATPRELEAARRGVALGAFLDAFGDRLAHVGARLEAARGDPDEALFAMLDLEAEISGLLLREFCDAEELGGETREALARLDEAFVALDVAGAYEKTLTTQWGLSRMSRTILLATLPSVIGSALMVLSYGEGAVAAMGRAGAAALVCGALALALFPIAAFVSYLLRFVLINQHTLPTTSFLLGPEDERMGEPRGG